MALASRLSALAAVSNLQPNVFIILTDDQDDPQDDRTRLEGDLAVKDGRWRTL